VRIHDLQLREGRCQRAGGAIALVAGWGQTALHERDKCIQGNMPMAGTRTAHLRHVTMSVLICAGIAVVVVDPGQAQQANPTASQAHIDAATTAAGTDLRGWLTLCRPVDPPPQNGATSANNPRVALIGENSAAEPMQVFDNLFFLGTKWVSAWAIRTSEGIILIDALNNDDEVEWSIVGGLRRLRLDPAQIKSRHQARARRPLRRCQLPRREVSSAGGHERG
jgi:hypothetical protein